MHMAVCGYELVYTIYVDLDMSQTFVQCVLCFFACVSLLCVLLMYVSSYQLPRLCIALCTSAFLAQVFFKSLLAAIAPAMHSWADPLCMWADNTSMLKTPYHTLCVAPFASYTYMLRLVAPPFFRPSFPLQ